MTTKLFKIEFWDRVLNKAITVEDYSIDKFDAWAKYKNEYRTLILITEK